MAVTYSMTPVKTFRSIMSLALISIAAAGSQTVTLVHRLGASPHEIRPVLRSLVTNASGFAIGLQVTSWNASQALVEVAGAGAGASAGLYDFVAEATLAQNE